MGWYVAEMQPPLFAIEAGRLREFVIIDLCLAGRVRSILV